MNVQELQHSLASERPPSLPPLAQALWWEAKGDWTRAHEIAQEIDSPEAAWVHAYLHRKEGKDGNADYWYSRAGRPHCRLSLKDEWAEIASALLASALLASDQMEGQMEG